MDSLTVIVSSYSVRKLRRKCFEKESDNEATYAAWFSLQSQNQKNNRASHWALSHVALASDLATSSASAFTGSVTLSCELRAPARLGGGGWSKIGNFWNKKAQINSVGWQQDINKKGGGGAHVIASRALSLPAQALRVTPLRTSQCSIFWIIRSYNPNAAFLAHLKGGGVWS